MSISVSCASCGTQHSIIPSMAGKKVRCTCGAVMDVPIVEASGHPSLNPSTVDPRQGGDPLQPSGDNLLPAPVDPLGMANSSTPANHYGTVISPEQPPQTRPGWIIPAGIGAGCLVVIMVIALIVFPFGSGEHPRPANNDPPGGGGEQRVAHAADGDEFPGDDEQPFVSSANGEGVPSEPAESETAPGNANPKEVLNSIGMRLTWVGGQEKGARKLGSVLPEKEFAFDKNNDPEITITADESPLHHVLLRKFMMGVHEVTQAEYTQIMGDNPSTISGADKPVHGVTWFQAMEFCKRLTELPAEKREERVYRLPSEAEWEYACRGGETSRYYFADTSDELAGHAWYRGNSGNTIHPVGQKKVNPSGTHDMLGNVWEWCYDWYEESYYGVAAGANSVRGPANGIVRVIRGGSSWNQSQFTRGAFRFFSEPQHVNQRIGFRVTCHIKEAVVSIPEPPAASSGFQDLQDFAEAVFTKGFPLAAIADRRDLSLLSVDMFDGTDDRPEIIKSAALFYDAIPSNVHHTVGRSGPVGEFQGAFAIEKESPGGLRYVDGMAIKLLQENSSSHVLMFGPVAQFGNGWKLTGRFDYINRIPQSESMFPLDELKTEIVHLPGENENYGLGYQRGAPVSMLPLVGVELTAVPFQICLSPDYQYVASVFAHEEIAQGLRRFTGKAEIVIWRLEDRSVVFQKEWTSEAVGGRIPLVAFTSDSKKVYYGKSRLYVVDLDTFQQAAEAILAPAPDNEWLLDPDTTEPVFLPNGSVSANKARFHQDGNIYVLAGNSVSVIGTDGTRKSSHDMTGDFRATFGVTRSGNVLGYLNKRGQYEDPRKGQVVDAYGKVILSPGWQSTGPRDARVKKIAVHPNWIPTTISPDGTAVYYNERIFTRDIMKIWHVQRRRPLFTLQYQLKNLDTSQLKPPYYSHDGRFLMQVIDRSIVIWKLDDAFSGGSSFE